MIIEKILSWVILCCIALTGIMIVLNVASKTHDAAKNLSNKFRNNVPPGGINNYNQPMYGQNNYNQPGYNQGVYGQQPGYNQGIYGNQMMNQPMQLSPMNSPNYNNNQPGTLANWKRNNNIANAMLQQEEARYNQMSMELSNQQKQTIYNFYLTNIQNKNYTIKPGDHYSKFQQMLKGFMPSMIDFGDTNQYIMLGVAPVGNMIYWRFFEIISRQIKYVDYDGKDCTTNVAITKNVDDYILQNMPEYEQELNRLRG